MEKERVKEKAPYLLEVETNHYLALSVYFFWLMVLGEGV
jgi:hypothetical protein